MQPIKPLTEAQFGAARAKKKPLPACGERRAVQGLGKFCELPCRQPFGEESLSPPNILDHQIRANPSQKATDIFIISYLCMQPNALIPQSSSAESYIIPGKWICSYLARGRTERAWRTQSERPNSPFRDFQYCFLGFFLPLPAGPRTIRRAEVEKSSSGWAGRAAHEEIETVGFAPPFCFMGAIGCRKNRC